MKTTSFDYIFSSESILREQLEIQGFDRTFNIRGELLECIETSELFRPDEVSIIAAYRFEGESDPAEMSVIYAIFAGEQERKGLIVDAFGTYGSIALGDFLAAALDKRAETAAALTAALRQQVNDAEA